MTKYNKGNKIPHGNTMFAFKAGNLSFKSTSFEWLVIAKDRAVFKGNGKVNKKDKCNFFISVVDGDLKERRTPDKFRIKIWNKADGEVIYDNEPNVAMDIEPILEIGGGSIVIHKPKVKKLTNEELIAYNNTITLIYPNPAKDYLNIEILGNEAETIQLKIYNSTGSLMHTYTGKGIINEEIDVSNYNAGLYMVTAIVKGKIITQKVLINK